MARRRATSRRVQIRRRRFAGIVVVIGAIGAVGYQSLASSTAASRSHGHRSHDRAALGEPGAPGALAEQGPLGEADGAIPDGTTVFDDDVPGVAKLNPDLLGALRQAATDAASEGVQFFVDSGWRSPAYQEQLLRQAVSEYGSEAEAARWVAPPDKSLHVSGDAVDIGPTAATSWLSEHGAAYGLCQIYANEPWHYELRPDAASQGCPAMYADPTQDPRLQP